MDSIIVISKWVLTDLGSTKLHVAEINDLTAYCTDISSVPIDLLPTDPNLNLYRVQCQDEDCHQTILTDDRFFVICSEGNENQKVSSNFIETLKSYLVGNGVHSQVVDRIFSTDQLLTYQQIIDELNSRIKTPGALLTA